MVIMQFVDINSSYAHLAIISFIFIITWGYIFNLKAFLIDDEEGIKRFDDKWDEKNQVVVNTYIHEDDKGNKTTFRNSQYNPLVGMPGSIIRWLRILIGRSWKQIAKNSKGHEVYGYVQSARKHHALSFAVHYANVLLAYFFLSRIFGEQLAFYTVLLFSCHPITCMAVSWISGIGYLTSLLFALISFNSTFFLTGQSLVYTTFATTYISCAGLLSGFANWIVLLWLGHWEASLASFLVSAFLIFTYGKQTVDYRKKQFSDQNMKASTVINWRKPIVIVKTLYYYLKMLVFPKRLGLFHTWGYHFEEKIERIDSMFWKGLICLAGLLFLGFKGPAPIQFGILWLLSYLILFSNVITAQQFVVDRYAFISSLGFCLVLAHILTPYPIILAFILGIYIMRTWVHLPTFSSQEDFYRSNIFNFPDSEVAYGNLGFIYLQRNMAGSAHDIWVKSLELNPFYDVPSYNLFSLYRSNGHLELAKTYLQKCLNSKIVHFRDRWLLEMAELDRHIEIKKKADSLNAQMNEAVRVGDTVSINKLREEILNLTNPPKP